MQIISYPKVFRFDCVNWARILQVIHMGQFNANHIRRNTSHIHAQALLTWYGVNSHRWAVLGLTKTVTILIPVF